MGLIAKIKEIIFKVKDYDRLESDYCTVAAKFSRQFSDEVSWQKVDPQAAAAASGEEDITEGGDNQGGGGNNNTPGGELEG